MTGGREDAGITYFLELDGSVYFVDDKCLYRIEIKTKRTDRTPERPHGLSYSLTFHNSANERIVGFDNAHPVPASKGPGGKKHKFHDHWHRYDRTRIYHFVDTEKLLTDFFEAVDQILKEKGVRT